jgi:hypothetical protein
LSEVIAGQAPAVVAKGECDDENHAEDSEREARHGDENPATVPIASPAAEYQGDNFDRSAGGAVEKGFFGCVAEADDELREEVREAACER